MGLITKFDDVTSPSKGFHGRSQGTPYTPSSLGIAHPRAASQQLTVGIRVHLADFRALWPTGPWLERSTFFSHSSRNGSLHSPCMDMMDSTNSVGLDLHPAVGSKKNSTAPMGNQQITQDIPMCLENHPNWNSLQSPWEPLRNGPMHIVYTVNYACIKFLCPWRLPEEDISNLESAGNLFPHFLSCQPLQGLGTAPLPTNQKNASVHRDPQGPL